MKSKQLQDILDRLDSIHAQLRMLNVPKSTLDSINAACESVELDLRQAASDESQD